MPELPEVETAKRGLQQALQNKRICHVELRRRDLRWPIEEGFEELLVDQRMIGFRRFGKYFVIDLENGWSVLGHLGMSGTFRVEPEMPKALRKHDHVLLTMESGEMAIYHDPRRFGFLLLSETPKLADHPRLVEMGPDPFDEKRFTADYLATALSKRKGPIKAVLLDQKLVAGIGNIYASEALFGIGVRPGRPANKLKRKEIEALVLEICKVLAAAIASGGSTLRDFSGSDGQTGYFQHHFKVYGHAGEPCESCSELLMVEVIAGRSSFFCKNCQK
jgi:formamidopyrimidine-DNA glycosylase